MPRLGGIPTFPHGAERRFARSFSKYIQATSRIVDRLLIPRLPKILGVPIKEKEDTDFDLLELLFRQILTAWSNEFTEEEMIEDVETMIEDVDEHASAQVKQSLGIDFLSSPQANKIFQESLDENVPLIKSIPRVHLLGFDGSIEGKAVLGVRGGVRGVIEEGFRQGARVEDIAEQIQAQANVSEARAKLIARDQVGSLNSALSADRFQGAGIGKFIWVSSRDLRVRELHKQLHGKEFSYASGGHPTEGLPGQPIQCRCVQRPVFEDDDD